jgi:hypothetical protein
VTATNYYAIGRAGDPDWWVGSMDDAGVFHWAMAREKFERVLAGNVGKHCETCRCDEQSADGSVIEDLVGTLYTRMQFVLGVMASMTGETRNLVKP